jgi:MYXO-CTERM domain-containing protein
MSTNDSVGAQDGGASTEQLRTEIEQTRAELGGDVAALSDKMNPRVRMRRAAGTARGTIASASSRARQAAPRTARQAGQTVRHHPVPTATGALALAGAAAAALLARRRAAKARAARKRAAAPWSALAGAAATALLARRQAEKARTARTRAAAGPWFRR